jgi:hypothetical protein
MSRVLITEVKKKNERHEEAIKRLRYCRRRSRHLTPGDGPLLDDKLDDLLERRGRHGLVIISATTLLLPDIPAYVDHPLQSGRGL